MTPADLRAIRASLGLTQGDMLDLVLLAFVPVAAFTLFVSIMLAWGAP